MKYLDKGILNIEINNAPYPRHSHLAENFP